MSLYPLYGLPNGFANLPSVLSLHQQQQQQQQQSHHHQQQQQMGQQQQQQQPSLLLNPQQAQQLFDASSTLSAGSSSSFSSPSSLSGLSPMSNVNQLSGGQQQQLTFNPLQLQAAAAGMWPQLTNFLQPVSLNLAAQHMQTSFAAPQPMAQFHQQHQQHQQQQHTQHQQSQPHQSQPHQQSQLHSTLSNSAASSVFPLPPAPLMPSPHPIMPSANAPTHVQSQPLPGESDKRRRSEENDTKSSKKRNRGSRRLSSAPSASASSSSSSSAVSPSVLPTSLTPPSTVHSIFSSPHNSTNTLHPTVSSQLTSPPIASLQSALANGHSTSGLPLSNGSLLQLSSLTLTGSLAPQIASLAGNNSASTLQAASLVPNAVSPSGRYGVSAPSASTHPASVFSSAPARTSTSRIDHDSISRTSSNDSGSDSDDDGESSSKRKTRKKHIVTDRQRRAKIKEGMTHLRGLLLEHGSFTTDQVSIMMASVQLIHKLKDERAAVEREKEMLAAQLEQMKHYTALFIAQHAANTDPNAAAAATPTTAATSDPTTSTTTLPTPPPLSPTAPTLPQLSVTPPSPTKSDTATPSPLASIKAELPPVAMLVAPVASA